MKNINLGKLKAIAFRELAYFSLCSTLMVAYLFFKEVGLKWYYLLAIPVFVVWIYIDIKYIMPKEITYIHSKSDILKKLNLITDQLNKIEMDNKSSK